MNLPELVERAGRANRQPRVFERFQVFYVGALAFAVFDLAVWGDGLAWGLLGIALAGLGLSVRGEICARRTRDGGGAL